MSTSFTDDPLNSQTVSPQCITVPQHYKYEVSPDGESLQTYQSVVTTSTANHHHYVPVHAGNSVHSSPQTTRRGLNGTNYLHIAVYDTNSAHSSQQQTRRASNPIVTHDPHIPVYATNSAQSSPKTTKKLVKVSDQTNTKTKKTRADGTETSNSWQAEKFEDSVVYKAKAKEMWKQAQQSPAKFQTVL